MTIDPPWVIVPHHKRWAAAYFVKCGYHVVTPGGRDWKDILTDDDYAAMNEKLYPQPPTGEYVDD